MSRLLKSWLLHRYESAPSSPAMNRLLQGSFAVGSPSFKAVRLRLLLQGILGHSPAMSWLHSPAPSRHSDPPSKLSRSFKAGQSWLNRLRLLQVRLLQGSKFPPSRHFGHSGSKFAPSKHSYVKTLCRLDNLAMNTNACRTVLAQFFRNSKPLDGQ